MADVAGRLKRSDWEVRPVDIAIARRLVERYHYAKGGSNTAVALHGLFRAGDIFDEQCQGVAWWIPPTRTAAMSTYPERWQGVLALSRLVIAPDVPANACTFLLARSRKLIDASAWPCLVTYADEWRGHSGAIYLADNWTFVGRTRAEPTFQINGRMISRKRGDRTRTQAEMAAMGAELVGSFAKRKFVLIRHGRGLAESESPA